MAYPVSSVENGLQFDAISKYPCPSTPSLPTASLSISMAVKMLELFTSSPLTTVLLTITSFSIAPSSYTSTTDTQSPFLVRRTKLVCRNLDLPNLHYSLRRRGRLLGVVRKVRKAAVMREALRRASQEYRRGSEAGERSLTRWGSVVARGLHCSV
ncbi:hypothetical protein BDY21DRAFT_333604 [Lineolata rhizophorae]|uniref:Uncharacterized protein n=1 Tax=Lineolata rhizophorae TaxID=578093 RepID=A0A6A6PAL1_9PEZI|nr:hypothetical protein BDY21DRAFT_333604 [Lineolata rhizophorae]